MIVHILYSSCYSAENPEAFLGQRKRLRLQLRAVTAMPLSLPRYDNEKGETSPFWACLLTYLLPFSLSADFLLANTVRPTHQRKRSAYCYLDSFLKGCGLVYGTLLPCRGDSIHLLWFPCQLLWEGGWTQCIHCSMVFLDSPVSGSSVASECLK